HFADYPQLLEEEVAELKEAVTSGNREAITEELGDAAWNLLYLLYLAQDERGVPLDTVLRGVLKKIVRRHEHVFGSVKAETPEEVLANWRKLKQREKRKKSRKA
ncbi:MAG: MazG nucleotide pyrophosphohydrolase domain-containing protein, partial [Methylocella sp.]